MTKFQILSFFIHLSVFVIFFTQMKTEVKPKFVQKKNMVVSVVNRKARVSNVESKIQKENTEEKKEKEKNIERVDSKVKKDIKKGKKKIVKSKENNKVLSKNDFLDKNRFIQGKDGIFTAIKSDGIEFEILKEVEPKYPVIAKKMGYSGSGKVTVKFLVDLDGEVKNIRIIAGESKYGFKEEVLKALKKWRFRPIVYEGKRIRATFEKTFIFSKK